MIQWSDLLSLISSLTYSPRRNCRRLPASPHRFGRAENFRVMPVLDAADHHRLDLVGGINAGADVVARGGRHVTAAEGRVAPIAAGIPAAAAGNPENS